MHGQRHPLPRVGQYGRVQQERGLDEAELQELMQAVRSVKQIYQWYYISYTLHETCEKQLRYTI